MLYPGSEFGSVASCEAWKSAPAPTFGTTPSQLAASTTDAMDWRLAGVPDWKFWFVRTTPSGQVSFVLYTWPLWTVESV
jgi:hypothetical protein